MNIKLILLFMLLPLYGRAGPPCNRVYVAGLNIGAVAKEQIGIEKISTALFEEIKKRAGCTYEEKNLSFTRAFDELRNRRIDLYAFAFRVPEWAPFADSAVLYTAKRLLLVKKEFYQEGATVKDYMVNPKIKFATVSGGIFFTNQTEIEELQKKNRILFDPFPDGVLNLLAQGKAQAVFTTPTYYSIYLEKYSLKKNTRVVIDPEGIIDLTLFISKNRMDASDRARFQQTVRDMRTDGSVRHILERFLPKDHVEKYYSF